MDELELLKKNISRYQNGVKLLKKKLSNMKGLRRKAANAAKLNEGKIKLRQMDIDTGLKKLNELKNQMKIFENQLQSNGKSFHNDMFNLEDLKLNIQQQTAEVIARTNVMNEACEQLKMSHKLSNEVCSSTRLAAFDAFKRWLLVQPLLKLWLSSDSQVVDTIYTAAHYEGIYEEICAHLEAKDSLELFADENYWEYSSSTDEMNHKNTLKQANMARYSRSQNFDSMHREMVVKLQHIVSGCEILKNEINHREFLRQKLNSYMMDLSYALEEDLQVFLNRCEREATKPATAAMNDMQQKILKPVQKAYNNPKVHLERNTASNAISILPTLINSFQQNKTARSTGDSSVNIAEAIAAIPSENDINDSIANDILKAYHENAIEYVKSFLNIKKSITWKWCNSMIADDEQKAGGQLEDIHATILNLFPLVHGPVELAVTQSIHSPNAAGQPSLPSTIPPVVRTPSRGLLKGNKTQPSQRESREEELMKQRLVEEGKSKMQDISNQSINQFGYSSSTNSNNNITLSERETHFNLKNIDLDEIFRHIPSPNANTATDSYHKYPNNDESHDNDAITTPTTKLRHKIPSPEVHQYRKHILSKDFGLSEEQIVQQNNQLDNEIDYDNLCTLYISMLDLSAHSAITARKVVRNLQSTSANITLETIAQIANVLSKATEEAKQSKDKSNNTNSAAIEESQQTATPTISGSLELKTVESRTTEALENISVEDQVHQLHQNVNHNFQYTRKEMESWISGDHSKRYVTFKTALIELLSTNQTSFSANEKADEADANNTRLENALLNIFEGDDYEMESNPLQRLESLSLKNKISNGSKLHSHRQSNGIDISKQIIASIQNNIQEFVANNDEAFGALESFDPKNNILDIENDLNKDEGKFNPRNYAFRSPFFDPFNHTAAVKASGTRIDKAAIKSASVDNISNLFSTTIIAQQSAAAITIPHERTVIHSMESVIRCKMFTIDLIWEPHTMQAELIMKNYTSKSQFKEYQFILSQSLLSELINTSVDLILQLLFGESIKILQAILGCLHLESIDDRFYEPITQRLASHLCKLENNSPYKSPQYTTTATSTSSKSRINTRTSGIFIQEVGFSPRSTAFALREIDDMLKPAEKIRRGSISSMYRIQLLNEAQAALDKALSRDYLLNEKDGLSDYHSSNESKNSKIESVRKTRNSKIIDTTNSINKNKEKEFSYLLEIITLRKKKQELLGYCFPLLCDLEIHEIDKFSTSLNDNDE